MLLLLLQLQVEGVGEDGRRKAVVVLATAKTTRTGRRSFMFTFFLLKGKKKRMGCEVGESGWEGGRVVGWK